MGKKTKNFTKFTFIYSENKQSQLIKHNNNQYSYFKTPKFLPKNPKNITFSSWFMRETRRELVVLVRSFGGNPNPFSIAYNRPKQIKINIPKNDFVTEIKKKLTENLGLQNIYK